MRVTIDQLRHDMASVARKRSVPEASTDLVVDHFLDAELRGKPTHGVAKFCFESQFFDHRLGSPILIRDNAATAVVDAQREIGPIGAMFALQLALRKAAEYGVGIVGMTNSQRYGTLGYWTEAAADEGKFAMVMNTTVPECVVPGGREAVLGVNPISVGAPAENAAIVADFAPTLATMGSLWEARRGVGLLARDAFVDAQGEFTSDPFVAEHAVVFGGRKGFALSTAIQLLAGALFGFPTGAEIQSPYAAGYLFLVMDPAVTSPGGDPAAAGERFRRTVQTSATRDAVALQLCGSGSAARRTEATSRGDVLVDDATLDRLADCLADRPWRGV